MLSFPTTRQTDNNKLTHRIVELHASKVEQTIMQKDKTLQFWDDFYRSEQNKLEKSETLGAETSTSGRVKEWIVQPSDELFRLILQDLFRSSRNDCGNPPKKEYYENTKRETGVVAQYKILEIGCGTSLLSDSLCKYWEHHVTDATKKLHIIATDVSPVCIEQQIALQKQQQLLQLEQKDRKSVV